MMATLKIKIIPSSSCDCITGWLDDILKIKVMAPPEKNKANKSALKKLSQWINVPIKNISIKNGNMIWRSSKLDSTPEINTSVFQIIFSLIK